MDDQPNIIKPDNPTTVSTSTPPASSGPIPNPTVTSSPLPQPSVVTSSDTDLSQRPSYSNPSPQSQSQVPQPLENPPQQGQDFVGQDNSTDGPASHNKRKIVLSVILIMIVALSVGAVFDFRGLHSSSKLDCVPLSGNTVNETTAITVYKIFAQAIKTSNQTCANSLSSTYFIDNAKVLLGAPNGNWITATPEGISSWASNFSKLPNNLSNAQFVNKAYAREITETANGGTPSYYKPATGLTVGYPSGNGGTYYLISFISQNGKIVVDNILEGPLSAG